MFIAYLLARAIRVETDLVDQLFNSSEKRLARLLLLLATVSRQIFWDRRQLKIRESLAPLVCNIMRLADGAASGDWRLSVV